MRPLTARQRAEVKRYIKAGHPIVAIKRLMRLRNLSVKDAMELMRAVERSR
jgi:hypothetical protein